MFLQNNTVTAQSQGKSRREAAVRVLRWVISAVCLGLIAWRLTDADARPLLLSLRQTSLIQVLAGIASVVLVLPNLGLEAARWRLCLTPVKPRSWRSHFAAVVAGISVGLPFTHLVGDYSGKLALARKHAGDAAPLLVASSFSQYLISFGGGIAAFWYLLEAGFLTERVLGLAQGLTLWLFLLLNGFLALPWVYQTARDLPFAWAERLPRKVIWPQLGLLLLLSLGRYLVILAQYGLIYYFFSPGSDMLTFLAGISITLGIKTLVPFLSIGGMIGLRELLALSIFTSMGFGGAGAVIVAVSLGVWLINVAAPALVGVAVLTRIRSAAWWQL